MNNLIFMPTPNWFISRPIEICEPTSGSIATCAINSIIFTKNLFDSYSHCIKDAHTKRLHGLSFYHFEQRNLKLLASCSEDLDIKVWDYETKSLLNQHKLHQNTPSCIDWLKFDSNLNQDPKLISCDIKGNIFKWDIFTNEHTRYFPENKPVTQVKACFNTFKIAVGYKHGTIVVLDIEKEQMKILHKLKNHQDSINCLLWCPRNNSEDTDIEARLKTELKIDHMESVLCSSSEDKTIRLWCTNKGIQLKCLKAPGVTATSSKSNQTKNQQVQTAKINYTPLCWPKNNLIISGSFKGELFYYYIDEQKEISSSENTVKCRQFTSLGENQAHKKIIFDIVSTEDTVLTLSLDRLINTWSLKSFKQESSMTTLNGFVYSIISSPIDQNFLAISLGDSSIKFINEKQNIKTARTFNNNIKSEVTQICWHPTKEAIIAFGTKDGKVGIADVMSNNKPAQYIFTNYNQSVYTLLWCEELIPDQNPYKNHNLYSVADGKIMQHCIKSFSFGKELLNSLSTNFYTELKKFLNEAAGDQTKENSIEYGLTEFSVLRVEPEQASDKSDYFFAIGKFDGSIEIYRTLINEKKIEKFCSFFNHQKLVTCIKWNVSSYSRDYYETIYLASGSNDFNVVLIDFKSLIVDLQLSEKNVNFYSKFKHKLVGHKERITNLSWSKALDKTNLLASCSYDSTVQIWNADTGAAIANYRGHDDKLLCCLFSPNDPNIIYSGGEDYCLHKWKIDGQEFKTPPEECQILLGKKKNKLIKKQQVTKKVEPSEIESIQNEKIEKQIETDELLKEEPKIEPQLKQSKQIRSSQAKNEPKSLLTLSSHGNKSQKSKLTDCLTLYEKLYENIQDSEIELKKFEFEKDQLNLCLFTNRICVLELLKLEQNELRKLNFEKWWIFDIWKGNICKIIKEFRDLNQLNEILFTLYQISTGYCENSIDLLNIFIEQLNKEALAGNMESAHKAVLYSLASYQVEKAIDIYLSNNLYQYALCIGLLRLPPNSPVLLRILNKYAMYSTHVGDYETAVLCYIRSGDFENAYKILLRRNTKNDLDFERNIKCLCDKLSTHFTSNKNI